MNVVVEAGSRRGRCTPIWLSALALVACSSHGDDRGAVTSDDQRQLNEAAAMLDANSVDANALGAHESSPHD